MKHTRKQKAQRLLELLEKGPVFSDYTQSSVMDQSPSAQFKRWSTCWVLPIVRELVPELKVRFKPLPSYGYKHTTKEFKEMVQCKTVTNDDGCGVWATYSQASDQYVDCSKLKVPEWATHVVWFNK